jgi:glucose-1-phosphate adenylyltransferase
MNALGIIFSYSERENLRELTKRRTLASLPIIGKYRIIDFQLSNYVNNGIFDVSIIARNNYHSLMDHLGAGKEWDLVRKRGGLRVLTPFARNDTENPGIYRGTVEALAYNMHSIRRSMAEYVIISGSSILCNVDYCELLDQHIRSNSDITVVYRREEEGNKMVPQGAAIMYFNEENRLYNIMTKSDDITSTESTWGMDIFVIRKSLLESLVADAMSYARFDFNEDILKRLVNTLNFRGYEYKGYLLEVNSVAGYMQTNMKFLDSEFRSSVFQSPVYTKNKDSVPSRYYDGCYVNNSIISDGCRIEGTVVNSVLSRGIRIGKNAIVKNSVIMQNTEIMRDVVLDHVILDKDVIVREYRSLSGHATYPVIVEKGSIV